MDYPSMHILGITGGIGSGKSEVLNFLKNISGTVIMEADKLAHRLMEPQEVIYQEIVEEFGTEVLAEDQRLDRKILGSLVFHDPKKLERLNAIVHPGVKRYILGEIERCRNTSVRLYVIEAALLIQDGYKNICDEIWYIHVPEELRIERLLMSRGGTREKWEDVMKAQAEEEYFIRNSDRVIENDGTVEQLHRQILDQINKLLFE